MADLLPLGTALVLGLVHSIDLDHVMAASTYLTGRPALGSAIGYGIRWGLGHSVVVLAAGILVVAFGVHIDARFERGAEIAVGAMLMLLGLFALKTIRNLHLHGPPGHGELHLHAHGGKAARRHGGTVAAPKDGGHQHPRRPWVVGMLHGLAGSSGAVAIVPVALIGDWRVSLGYLVVFCLGVTLGMVLFALGLAEAVRRATGRSVLWGRRIGVGVALASIVVGGYWVVR